MYRPTNKHYQHVVDVVRTSSTSFIALTPTNVVADKQPIRSKLAPASMRSQSLPASSAERSKISPKNSFISSMDIEDWFIAPTYVCSMHSTKDGLTESYRQALLPKDEVIQVVVKQIKHPSYSYITPLTFVISLHHMTHEFKMDYSDYRKFVRAMVATPVFQAPIRNLYVSKMLEDSFVGAVRRALGSVEYLSKELAGALNDLVQLPQLAAHPSFLKLCHIDSFRAIYEVLVHGSSDTGTWELPAAHRKDAPTPVPIDDDDDEGDNSSNSTEPTSLDGSHDCLCALFAYATTLFASHIARDAVAPAAPPVDDIPHHLHPQSNDGTTADALPSVEKVLCLDLMQSRSLLVYYTDTTTTCLLVAVHAGQIAVQRGSPVPKVHCEWVWVQSAVSHCPGYQDRVDAGGRAAPQDAPAVPPPAETEWTQAHRGHVPVPRARPRVHRRAAQGSTRVRVPTARGTAHSRQNHDVHVDRVGAVKPQVPP
ncbi:hypothetical protein AaE_005992 [Aphanomyces astaci]|uniref:Uncharacterized protein n=1 Tax=Aphanomyces astaci TaxID=112090 RepID=A0A6A5A6G0_APHAT|nr:hypothetical protein AaE_005992 [Aphanomyces astaci]